jgi:hypothetical protein
VANANRAGSWRLADFYEGAIDAQLPEATRSPALCRQHEAVIPLTHRSPSAEQDHGVAAPERSTSSGGSSI